MATQTATTPQTRAAKRQRASRVARLELVLLEAAQLAAALLAADAEHPEAKRLSLLAHRVHLAYAGARELHR